MRKGRFLAIVMAATMLISTLSTSSVYMAATSDILFTEKTSVEKTSTEKTSTDDAKISEYREKLNYRDVSDMDFDLSFEDEEESGLSRNWGTLPESYSSSAYVDWDFEKVNDYITPVKNQNPYGTCWAHSTIAAAEATYIINQGITDVESIDFNEYHLVHYTYDTPENPLGLFGGDATQLYMDETFLDAGGNNMVTLGVLANWIGVSDSTDFTVDDVEGDNPDSVGYEDAAHLENGYYVFMPDMTSDDYQTDMNVVKSMLMDYGAMAASYYSCTSGGDEFDGYYYCPNTYGTNHAVTIVGWDDTIPAESFKTTAPGDGAWLIKNSWGENGDFGGYFWLSYYDATLADEAYVYDMVPADNYDNNYQYDGASNDYYTGYMDSVVFANAFVADSVETLKAVGFYTYDINVDYEIRVYKNLESDEAPQYGDLVLTQTGKETYAGFHTVELNSFIDLDEDERYAVVVTLTKEGDFCYAGIDTSVDYSWIGFQSNAKAGESYLGYSVDSLEDLNVENTEYADGTNVRVKAYTDEGVTTDIASGTCGNNLTWTLDDTYTLTISGTGDMWSFYPGESGYKSLPWQTYQEQITKVVFKEGVTSVGNAAFWAFRNIEKVVFAESITRIGNFAFNNCSKIESVDLPENLQILGQECFACCNSLKELIIPDNIIYYDGGIAEWCDSLEYVYIGGSTEVECVTWADTLFRGCPALEAIEVSEDNLVFKSVDGVLYSKDGKELIQYPGGKEEATFEVLSTTQKINNFAFERAIYLESVVIPEGVNYIGVQAFGYCSALKSFTIPSTVTTLEEDILNQSLNIEIVNNTSSTEFVLPPLESGVWKDAEGNVITSITNGVAYRGEETTEDNNIGQCGDNVYWSLDENMVLTIYGSGPMWNFASGFADYHERPWAEYRTQIKKVVFSEGVTTVGSGAFLSHYAIETVEFADSITKIDYAAFLYCESLTNFELPDGLTSLGQECFSCCDSITQLIIPDGVRYYGGNIVRSCDSLEYIYIGGKDAWTAITYAHCLFGNCPSLKEIEVSEKNGAFKSIDGVLYTKDGAAIMQYPAGRTDTIYEILPTTTEIYQTAFEGSVYLEKVIIPEGVTKIESIAFARCEALETLIIPSTVISLETSILTGSNNITMINNKSNVEFELPVIAGVSWTDLDGNSVAVISNGVAVTDFENLVAETGVVLDTTSATLSSGETLQLSATVSPADATYADVIFASSDTALATVDSSGFVTVNKNGNAGTVVITATTACTNQTATCTIVVEPVKVSSISFSYGQTLASVRIGDSFAITATVNPSNATNKALTWETSNANVATVDENGKVTAVGKGTVTITATAKDGSGVNKSCTFDVKAPVATDADINVPNDRPVLGEQVQLSVIVTPSNADYTVSWESSDDSKATVDANGLVSTCGIGEVTITAYVDSEYYYWEIDTTLTVLPILVSEITLNKTSLTLNKGEVATLIATVGPENAENKNVKWNSHDETVATVDANGKVTAIGTGTAIITATAADGSGVSASCTVTVNPTKVSSITLNKTALELVRGTSASLIATVTPTDADNKAVTWSSSNTNVATVDTSGNVTAVGVGTATITATAKDGSGVSASCSVTVKPILVSAITLNKTTLELINGNTETLTATVTPVNADNKAVTWSSSNTNVATVDANGKITAVGVGTATITATAKDGSGVSASCSVTVKPILVSAITLNKTTLELINGSSETLTITATPENAANKAVIWFSSNTSVATVDENGTVTAVGVGTATITAITTDGSGVGARCTVIVNKQYPDGLNEYTDGKLYYFKDNQIDTTYNGVADYEGDTWYVKNGAVDTAVNGLQYTSDTWYLFKDGKVNRITTVEKNAYGWWYISNGELDANYDGLGTNSSGTWYIENGKVDFGKTGVFQRGGAWYYFKGGQVQYINSVEKNSSGWWYIKNGKVDFSYDGVGKNASGTWYIENGKVDFGKTGVFQRGGAWYYFKGGQVQFINSVEKNSSGWWYIKNGKVDFSYDGVGKNSTGTWYIENGKVDFGKTGVLQRGGTWYYFKGGKVQFINSVEKNSSGWWYIKNGKVDFGFKGIGKNSSGSWYIKNGKVDFGYSGTYKFQGKTYKVVKGKATLIK